VEERIQLGRTVLITPPPSRFSTLTLISSEVLVQGGALALLSLRQAVGLAGVLSMSGYLTMSNETLVSEANKATPLLMCHGTADPVVNPPPLPLSLTPNPQGRPLWCS